MSSFMLWLLVMVYCFCCCWFVVALYILLPTHTVSVLSWFRSLEIAFLEMCYGSDFSRISTSPPQPGLTFTASHTGLSQPCLREFHPWYKLPGLSSFLKPWRKNPQLLHSCIFHASKANISQVALAAWPPAWMDVPHPTAHSQQLHVLLLCWSRELFRPLNCQFLQGFRSPGHLLKATFPSLKWAEDILS